MATRDFQQRLKARGYVVVPTPLANPKRLANVIAAFDAHLKSSPEFKDARPDDPKWRPVLGGFAALGNPSSYHHRFVRLMREAMMAVLLDLDVLPTEGRLLEQVFDRLMMRFAGESPTAEGMHRDESPNAKDKDDIFGGWVNVDTTSQFFLCAPRTHLEVGSQNTGFAAIKDTAEVARLEPLFRSVEIPSGHCLVFYERLVHKVAKSPAQATMRRMFLGWRVTLHREPLFGNKTTLKWIEDQAVPKIKSSQDPRVWPSCYGNFPRNFDRLRDWSQDTFAPVCLHKHTIKSGARSGEQPMRVPATMKSLREYALPMHRAYDEHEIALLFPQRELKLHTFGSKKRSRFVLPTEEAWASHKRAKALAPEGAAVVRPKPTCISPTDRED